MHKAFIISTGTELLLGTTFDSNSVYLAHQLGNMGIKVVGKAIVGDSREQMERAFRNGLESADIVIASGGLGPTYDDLTKTVACELMGCPAVIRPEEEARLRTYFAKRQRPMPDNNLKQAMFPPAAEVLPNFQGTAPGMYLRQDRQLLILLPGPPREMIAMYQEQVKPRLERDYGAELQKVVHRTIKVLGPGESQVEEMLSSLNDHFPGCSIALLAEEGEIHIKITVDGSNIVAGRDNLEKISRAVQEKLTPHIFGYDDETLAQQVGQKLAQNAQKLVVAESCTAGMLGSMITEVAGSSEYFWGGVIAYNNQCKVKILGVGESTLARYGAVSYQTAEEMARGARQLSCADFALAITGIAGPGGGSKEKPVGLVYIALAHDKGCRVKELKFVGSRETIRKLAAKSALDLLRRHLNRSLSIVER